MTTVAAGCPDPRLDGTSWLRIGLRVVIVCAVVALFFCLLQHSFADVVENFVYSEAIGIAICASFLGLRRAGFLPGDATFRSSLARGAIAVPVGFVGGMTIGGLLLGHPIGWPSLQRTSPFGVVVSVVTSVCVIYFFWSRGRLAEAARVEADARRTTAEARLKLLQTQIEPHMLFNTLANLRTLVEVDTGRAQAMIDQLIVYLRGTLAASRSTTTTLEAEFAQLTAYLELMQVRMASRLRFTLELPGALRGASMPPMLLQPLVENAIKHGLEPKIAGGSVRVSATAVENRLRIDVVDDGIGLDASADPGYGLEHVRERLSTLYGDAGRASIDARPEGGVVARVELPR